MIRLLGDLDPHDDPLSGLCMTAFSLFTWSFLRDCTGREISLLLLVKELITS